eukprot:2770986-Pyramimonas_sp.AAC.1
MTKLVCRGAQIQHIDKGVEFSQVVIIEKLVEQPTQMSSTGGEINPDEMRFGERRYCEADRRTGADAP